MSSDSPSFTLTAPPNTDAWRKPPSKDTFNAPSRAHSTPFPLIHLSSGRVTFAANWVTQYDQAGLLLTLTPTNPSHTDPTRKHKTKWLKTGIEFYNNRPFISTVATENWSDWSLYPVSTSEGSGKVTVEVRREKSAHGEGLWIYWVRGEERVPLREVCWFFDEQERWDVEVAAYTARPAGEQDVGGKELEVRFWDLEVEKQ